MTGPPEQPAAGHRILAAAPGESYDSITGVPMPRGQRVALGKSLRDRSQRRDLADWRPAQDRADVVEQVRRANLGRTEWLVPVRIGRMIASPYGFLRGAAAIMADDFAALPATGITPVICGDAHLGNFGFYASPERQLVFDLNDFDEAHPGAWEWDVRRLVASVWVAGRQNGHSETDCAQAVSMCLRQYREHLNYLAHQPLLARSYERLDAEKMGKAAKKAHRTGLGEEIRRSVKKARKRTSDRVLPKFTTSDAGVRTIVEDPPLITRLGYAEATAMAEALDSYLSTLPMQWRRILGGYSLIDVAHKVVGVGSVGLRAYVALCEGSDSDDVLFLQIKQARRSVVARHVHGDSAWHAHQGQRVVDYQQALQTVSDPLLGWTSAQDRQYYVRQFRDMKGAITVDGLTPETLRDYAGVCGLLLAKGHARTSGASMIAGYLGKSPVADDAFGSFAAAYADQTERDHERLVRAVRRGDLPAEEGI